jgi:hypothetical protein
MATLGNSTAPSATNWNDSVASNREFWNHDSYTMPAGGGVATQMNVYFGGFGGNATVQFVIWNASTNAVVWNSGNLTYNSTIAWKAGAISPGVYLPAGTYYLGFYAANGQNVQWDGDNVSANNVWTKQGLSGPSANSGGGNEYGSNNYGGMGIYVTYTPGGVAHVRRSGVWSAGVQPKVRRSGVWVAATNTQVDRTGTWKSGT